MLLQEISYIVHTKTLVPFLLNPLLCSGRPFLNFTPPPHVCIWLFCKETFCCLKGEVMFSWKCTGCEVVAPRIHQWKLKAQHHHCTETMGGWITTAVVTLFDCVQGLVDSWTTYRLRFWRSIYTDWSSLGVFNTWKILDWMTEGRLEDAYHLLALL